MPNRIVVDASVVLKWYLDDEEHCTQACLLRDDISAGALDVVVPSLLLYEVANALNVAVNRARLLVTDPQTIMNNLITFGLPPVEGEALVVQALSLAQSHGRSVYDAAYLALAQALSIPLYTGDKRLYNAVHPALPWVLWIGDYPAH